MEDNMDYLKNLKQMMDPKNRPHILRTMIAVGNKEILESLLEQDGVDLQIDGTDFMAVREKP